MHEYVQGEFSFIGSSMKYIGKIGSVALKDPEIRKIPPKDRGHVKYHRFVGI